MIYVKKLVSWLTEAEIAWLAGVVESEGCIGAYKTRQNPQWRARLSVAVRMVDRDIVERVASLFDARAYSTNTPTEKLRGAAPTWSTCAHGAKAEKVLMKIRPYMGKRRAAKIDEVLALNLSHHPRKVTA